MPQNVTNQNSYTLGKGSFLRILFRTNYNSSTGTLLVVPGMNISCEHDPGLENMTEGDSIGEYWAPTVEKNIIRMDLRRRTDPISLDALGLMTVPYFDYVAYDVAGGGGLKVNILQGMSRAAYNWGAPSLNHIQEGFALIGGAMTFRNVALPTWLTATTGAGGIPNLAGYIRTGVPLP